MEKEKLLWHEISAERITECRIFDVYNTIQLNSDKEQRNFFLLKAPDWVSVVPILYGADNKRSFLMVRQYRFGIKQLTIEFPAGMANKGEAPEVTAQRELQEETGYTYKKLIPVHKFCANPAFMDNWLHIYFATGLEKTSA